MKKTTKFLISIFLLLVLVMPVLSFGAGLVPCGGKGESGCTFNDIFTLIQKVLDFTFLSFVLPLSAIMFAYAGFLLITSGGEASKKEKAKKIFLNVFIGLVIALGAFLIVKSVLVLAGYDNDNTKINWFGF